MQDCGATLYGDFNCSDLREVDKLGRELQATGYEDEVQDDHGIKMVPTSQEQSDTSDPIGLGSVGFTGCATWFLVTKVYS